MNEVIILAAALADETWEVLKIIDIVTDLTPKAVERSDNEKILK